MPSYTPCQLRGPRGPEGPQGPQGPAFSGSYGSFQLISTGNPIPTVQGQAIPLNTTDAALDTTLDTNDDAVTVSRAGVYLISYGFYSPSAPTLGPFPISLVVDGGSVAGFTETASNVFGSSSIVLSLPANAELYLLWESTTTELNDNADKTLAFLTLVQIA